MSDASFTEAFSAPTECLRSIDDVLDELTCIKRVFQDQVQVWEEVHSGDQSCAVCRGFSNICASRVVPKRSLDLALRLEEDALKVRESVSICSLANPRPTIFGANSLRQVVTLLTLLQGEASTENALRASEQSKILAVFTVVTVLFVSLRPNYFMSSPSQRHADKAGSSVVGDQPLCRRNTEFPAHLDYERPWPWIMYVYISLFSFSYPDIGNPVQLDS